MTKTTLGIIGVVIAGASFFSRINYDQAQTASLASANSSPAVQNGQARMGGSGGQRGMRGGFNGASGSIVAKDATSITLNLRDGSGSKIIFISPSATITKSVEGTAKDLIVGKEVLVNGSANSDGSINAQSIQLRSNFATSTPR